MAVWEKLSDHPQAFRNGEIHCWYNFVLGFSDKLVASMIERLAIDEDQLVLDPFCGTGTTLVESMKRGISSVGIDASPFSCFVSRVKTNASLSPDVLMRALIDVGIEFERARTSFDAPNASVYKYLESSGMLARGWISKRPLQDALALKDAIYRASPNAACRDAFLLALVANLSTKIGNMKYGPEIYCGPAKVYKSDRDAQLVRDNKDISALAEKIAHRCKDKTHGFARLYPTVIRAYFGGMKRHLLSMSSVLAHGGRYAMVVGDQGSYLGTHVPTADLLGQASTRIEFVYFAVRRAWRICGHLSPFSAILAPVASPGGASHGARSQPCPQEPRHLL